MLSLSKATSGSSSTIMILLIRLSRLPKSM
jgi:hypothetical protein